MTQKEQIIRLLKVNGTMTQGDLSLGMYGDRNHLPNLYMSLMDLVRKGIVLRRGEHPAYYSLADADTDYVPVRPSKKPDTPRMRKPKLNLPKPTIEEVEKWLKNWHSLEDYVAQENAIDRLFKQDYPSNEDLDSVLIKCSVLNDFYSTHLSKTYPMAKHILSLHIDKRLEEGDPTLVDEIAKDEVGGRNNYSFATKYCSHHKPLDYPIYDSYVHKVLKHYQNVDRFCVFEEKDLRNYPKFKDIILKFRTFYRLEKYTLKELDRYLWQFGKRYFPKNQ